MIQSYKILVGKDVRATFSGNFAEASSPILLEGDSTPFQVADARHRPGNAAQILVEWCFNRGVAIVGKDENFTWVAEDNDPDPS